MCSALILVLIEHTLGGDVQKKSLFAPKTPNFFFCSNFFRVNHIQNNRFYANCLVRNDFFQIEKNIVCWLYVLTCGVHPGQLWSPPQEKIVKKKKPPNCF